MATKGFMYEGVCYSYPEYYRLKDTLDSKFPIFAGNGTTLKVYQLNGATNITSLGKYVLSVKDENGVIKGINVQLLQCDYDYQSFMPFNTTDLVFAISIIAISLYGFGLGLKR